MNVEDVTRILDDPEEADAWLMDLRFTDLARSKTNLDSIARSGITIDQFSILLDQLRQCFGEISDPDMALNNLERFVIAARNPIAVCALFERDPTALPILMRIFSASQFLSDLLIRDTESYDSLRLTEGQLYSRDALLDELVAAVGGATENMQAMQILRRFKHRETLRIAFGDLIVGHRLEQTVEQISFLADAIIEAARHFAFSELAKQLGQPMVGDQPCKYVVLALGKLGGCELNYSSDIDLIAIYEADGQTEIKGKSNQDFFQRLTRDMIRLLNETTSLGAAYRVDMRLRPEGSRGPVCSKSSSFLRYYDLQGRTWERQALIKARPVAGDLEFGNELLANLQNWIYRPILNRFDIQGIKSLKRQIENRAIVSGEEKTNVKTGYGGIRDIEFTIQFLQLLHGGAVSSVRSGNTIEAIRLLANAGCLNRQESDLLTQNYCWLRKLEHLLQIMFDLQTHTLPDNELESGKIALRMGYRDYFGISALQQFQTDLKEVTEVNNRILNHLLHSAFGEEADHENQAADCSVNAVDLILQSGLSEESIEEVLKSYRFVDYKSAARNIESLASESTLFLSSRRSRHFLASIIVELLEKIAQTPDPDATLVSLSSVADAIGGKAALWELFSFNSPSLEMFVRLCACSDYLCSIVRRNPGMIDELIDSLLMDRLPAIDWLRINLNELTSGASDKQLIVHSFKHVQHLRVGIRDIIARDPVQETHRALSDVAEVCVEKIADVEFIKCAAKYSNLGMPIDQIEERNSLVIIALGKLGGREPNYHSDLDVLYLYDSEEASNVWIETSSQHFYSELAAKITKSVSHRGPAGRLYEIDCRLRPSGKSGALAVSLNEFVRYFESGQGQLWERQALCKARPVFGNLRLRERAMSIVHDTITGIRWHDEMMEQIASMRMRMQENCHPSNLKRGVGGTVDIEFIVQMLQLKNAAKYPQVIVPGTIEALDELLRIKAIDRDAGVYLIESYQYLRGVEARLRLMNTTARHDMPTGNELAKLAFLLRLPMDQLSDQVAEYRQKNREVFTSLFELRN